MAGIVALNKLLKSMTPEMNTLNTVRPDDKFNVVSMCFAQWMVIAAIMSI